MINLALIGCGKWGRNYLKTLASIESCALTWVCDLDPQTLAEATSCYPQIRCTENISDILNDATVQGVIIATTPESHYTLAKKFIAKGKAVLVEKPVTLHQPESLELITLAAAHNTLLMAGYTLIYHPAVQKLKELLKENPLCYINMSRTNGSQISGVDVLHDLAVHDIYLARYLTGEDPTWVMAQAGKYAESINNNVIYILLGFPHGRIASIFASFIHTQKTRKMTLVTAETKLVFDDVQPTDKKLHLYVNDHKHPVSIENLAPLTNECLHFIECISEHKEPHSGKEAIDFVAKMTDHITASLAKGGEKIKL